MAVKLTLPGYVGALRHSPARDIVFVYRENGKIASSFSIGYLQPTGALQLTELTFPNEDGIASPTGMYRIDGEIVLAANSENTTNAILRVQDYLWEMHLLFADDTALSIPWRDLKYSGNFQHMQDRYPLAHTYRDRFGVKLSNSMPFGGVNKEHRLTVSGFTMEAYAWSATPAQFYATFPGLDRGLIEGSLPGYARIGS